MTCDHCETRLTASQLRRRARFCSDRCRKAAYRRRQAEARTEEFRAALDPSVLEGEVATREDVLVLLWAAARTGSMLAAKTLLEELRRDAELSGIPDGGVIDEIVRGRKSPRIG